MKKYPLIYKDKIISKGRSPSLHPIFIAFIDLYYGLIVDKFPLCCVKQFVIETIKCEPSGYKRNQEFDCSDTNGTGFVPCDKCLKGKEL